MWQYLPVLNACIRVLVSVGLGSLLSFLGVFEKAFVPHAVKYVFYVAIPCLICRGIGLNVDFYSEQFIWKYICAFLILRAIALVFSFGFIFLRKESRAGIGDVAVMWLSLTWISTVILGVPIMTAVLGDRVRGAFYGLLAGISSFIFQLPLQLLFLECHACEQEELRNEQSLEPTPDTTMTPDPIRVSTFDTGEVTERISNMRLPKEQSLADVSSLELLDEIEMGTSESTTDKNEEMIDTRHSQPESLVSSLDRRMRWSAHAVKTATWKRVGMKVLRNPVLWGILIGFVLSLSTVGKTYLKPGGEDSVAGLAWIDMTLEWFGTTTSPVSLFAMGVWMQKQGKQLMPIPLLQLVLFMFSKLVVVPFLMVLLALALGLDDESGRASVLIASLPISLASFSLAEQYEIGQAVLSANVAVGTFLMTPTVLIWTAIMDSLDLFPVAKE